MSRRYIFSSESVTEGHPDKVCDTISDTVLDACLAQDRHSRVACETYAKSNVVIVGGEITTKAKLDYVQIVRDTVREIGYVNDDDKETAEQGAGDQGLMFGYACDETPELMPAPIMFAHRLGRELTRIRKSGKAGWLRPDAKSQVSVIYENGKPIGISCVVVSTQHTRDVKHSEIRSFVIENVIKEVLPEEMLSEKTQFLVNPTGNFVVGGPQGDTGLTGRKIIVDSYGGMGRHGGGAFSGKDPSKVDRSAAYMGRWVAKNVVAAGLASKCEVQFAYAIGHPKPLSVHVDTFCTSTVDEEAIERAVLAIFSFKPADIIKQLDLLRPIYSKTTNYGHFGKVDDPDITWEKANKAAQLKKAAK